MSVLTYAVYIVFRSTFYALERFCFFIFGAQQPKTGQLEVCKILMRCKLVQVFMARPVDFLWIRRKIEPIEILLDPHWMLYTFDTKYAYFVEMPKWDFEYSVANAPFIYVPQFCQSTNIGKVTLDAFLLFAEKIPSRQGQLICISSAARSGSTLLAQLLQATNEATVLGEPDALTLLVVMLQKKQISQVKFEKCLGATMKFLCKSQKANDIYIIKTRSICVRMVPTLKKICPDIKHVYLFRKDTRRVLKSLVKMIRKGHMMERAPEWLCRLNLKIATMLFGYADWDPEFLEHFQVNDFFDYALMVHVGSYSTYMKNSEMFDIPWIMYENLVDNPQHVLMSLFKLCSISENAVDRAMEVFHKDSQVGTLLSRKSLKSVSVKDEISKEDVSKVKTVCECLGVPVLTM